MPTLLTSDGERDAPRILAQLELCDDVANDFDDDRAREVGALPVEHFLTRRNDDRPRCEQRVDVIGLRWHAGGVAQATQPRFAASSRCLVKRDRELGHDLRSLVERPCLAATQLHSLIRVITKS